MFSFCWTRDESEAALMDKYKPPEKGTRIEVWWRNCPLFPFAPAGHCEFYIVIAHNGAQRFLGLRDIRSIGPEFRNPWSIFMGKWETLDRREIVKRESGCCGPLGVQMPNICLFEEAIDNDFDIIEMWDDFFSNNKTVIKKSEQVRVSDLLQHIEDNAPGVWQGSMFKEFLEANVQARDQYNSELRLKTWDFKILVQSRNCQHLAATALVFAIEKFSQRTDFDQDHWNSTIRQLANVLDMQWNNSAVSKYYLTPSQILRQGWRSIANGSHALSPIVGTYQVVCRSVYDKHLLGQVVYVPNVHRGLVDPSYVRDNGERAYQVRYDSTDCFNVSVSSIHWVNELDLRPVEGGYRKIVSHHSVSTQDEESSID